MTFLTNHFLLFVCSVLLGIGAIPLIRIAGRYLIQKNIERFDTRQTKILLLCAISIFLIWGYLTKPIFYFRDSIGCIGDSYIYMGLCVEKQGHIRPHNPAHPFLAEKALIAIEKTGLLSPKDPLYLEKAYLIGSLPARISTVIGLGLCFILFYLLFQSFYIAVGGFLIMSFSFALWLWGLQSHALGIANAMEIYTLFVGFLFIRTQRLYLLALLGIVIGLNLYAHNSLIFFSIGMFCFAFIYLFFYESLSFVKRLYRFMFFIVPLFIVARIYYYLELHLTSTSNCRELLNYLSDAVTWPMPIFGELKSFSLFINAAKDIIVRMILNLTNFWNPTNIFETSLILVQIASLTALCVMIGSSIRKNIRNIILSPFFILFFLPSLAIFCGRFVKCVAPFFFSGAVVPNLFLFMVLLFLYAKSHEERIQRMLVLLLFCSALFLFNTATSRSVFSGRNANDNKFYKEYATIQKNIGSTQKAYYLTHDEGFNAYGDGYVLNYYAAKFKNITKITSFPEDAVAFRIYINNMKLTTTDALFIETSVFEKTKHELKNFETKQISDTVWLIRKK